MYDQQCLTTATNKQTDDDDDKNILKRQQTLKILLVVRTAKWLMSEPALNNTQPPYTVLSDTVTFYLYASMFACRRSIVVDYNFLFSVPPYTHAH